VEAKAGGKQKPGAKAAKSEGNMAPDLLTSRPQTVRRTKRDTANCGIPKKYRLRDFFVKKFL
jgi:hypothetical protein